MPYTIIPSFAPGTHFLLTVTEMNQIINNIVYTLGGRDIAYKEYLGADKTTTGTSFAAVDTTNFRLTSGTINSGRYLVFLSAEWAVTTLNNKVYADMYVDGTTRATNGNSTSGIMTWNNPNQNSDRLVLLAYFTGLSVATHTFDLYWKVSAGTGSIFTSVAKMQMLGIEI